MTRIENVRITFPDVFGINSNLRNKNTHNSQFIELAIKSHDLISHMRSQKLAIADALKVNQNLNIYDHQVLAAQKVKNELGGTAILADEVGLGKTIEAGIVIKEFLTTGLAKKVLILTPPSLLRQWQEELTTKFNLKFVSQHDGSKFSRPKHHDLLLMSHSSAIFPKYRDELVASYWDLVIVDEAHSMKNASTQKHQFVKSLPKRNLLLLTATPLQNNIQELYNLIELLRPGYLGTWSEFQNRYMVNNDSRSFNVMFKDELQKTLSNIIIRTRRKEVSRYIPFKDRIPHTEILTPQEDEVDLYDSITDIVRSLYYDTPNSLPLMIYQRLASSSTDASKMALYKMLKNKHITRKRYDELINLANGIIIDSKLSKLLETIENNTSKFLIFTEFYDTQNYVANALRKSGYSVELFNGKMNSDEKFEAVKQFRGNAQVLVSTSAGGEGQNFQFCHNVVNYDLPWNPMRVEQKIGRVHRIGQTENVHIFNYALKGTIEEYILDLLYVKINLFQMTLGDMDLLFEDSWGGGSPHTWFKEYMSGKNKDEIKNRFSVLWHDWSNRKKNVHDAIKNFNEDVFANFNLSVLEDLENESAK